MITAEEEHDDDDDNDDEKNEVPRINDTKVVRIAVMIMQKTLVRMRTRMSMTGGNTQESPDG